MTKVYGKIEREYILLVKGKNEMRISKESYDKIASKINDLENKIVNFNEKHYPAGSSKGGQFAPKGAGGSSSGGESKGGTKDSKKYLAKAEEEMNSIIDSLDELSDSLSSSNEGERKAGEKTLEGIRKKFETANLNYAKASLIDRYGSKPKIEKKQDEDGVYYRVDMPNYRGARGVEYGTERLAQKGGYGWGSGIEMSGGEAKAMVQKHPTTKGLYVASNSKNGLRLPHSDSYNKQETSEFAKAFNVASEQLAEKMKAQRAKFDNKVSRMR